MKRFATTLGTGLTAAALLAALAGCSQAPSYDILGSLFPAWILCIAVGVLLTAGARWLLVRYRVALVFPVLTYPCLTAFFTFAMWLIFFSR